MIADVAHIVQVVGNRLDVLKRVGVEVLAPLPVIAAPLDHVPQMRNHAGGNEGLALVVEVHAPRIAGPV